MEDLLASIRKAIHEDIGEIPQPGKAAGAGPIKGSMRELRVRVADEVNSAAAEIDEIKARAQRAREAEAALNARPVPPRPGGFTEIMSGDRPGHRRRFDTDVPYEPPLRPRYTEAEPARSDTRYRAADPLPPREEPRYLPPPEPRLRDDDHLLSPGASAAAGSAFGRLAETMLARATGDRSLEDMTKELLRSMLKQWLDENLPGLVERLVREEIERVARRGR
jgi:cell pole-organizing protein PopZ